jgi:hypothetical protein
MNNFVLALFVIHNQKAFHNMKWFWTVDIEKIVLWWERLESNAACLTDGGTSCRYESVTLADRFVDMEVEQPMTFSEVDTSRLPGMVSLLLLSRKKNGDVCHVYDFLRGWYFQIPGNGKPSSFIEEKEWWCLSCIFLEKKKWLCAYNLVLINHTWTHILFVSWLVARLSLLFWRKHSYLCSDWMIWMNSMLMST